MNSTRQFCFASALVLALGSSAFAVAPSKEGGGLKPPNIMVLLCDDLGYGDVQCLNPERGKIPTPHLDALAIRALDVPEAKIAVLNWFPKNANW